MIILLHLSMMFMVCVEAYPDAENWVKFILIMSMLICYTAAIYIWDKHFSKVKELESELKKLKENKQC